MPHDQSTMQAYYAARAREYDRLYLKPERQADLRAMEQWLPVKLANRRLLEIACETGYWTQFIAEGNTFQTRTLDDRSAHEVLKNFPTELELRDLVVGFGEGAVYTEWEFYCAFEYIVL